MSTHDLALLGTLAWLIATTVLFVVLASWSAGSWDLTATIVNGMRGWSRNEAARAASLSPGAETLAPLGDAAVDQRRHVAAPGAAQLEELGERRTDS